MKVDKLVSIKENPNVLIVNDIYDYNDPLYVYIPVLKKTTFKMQDYLYKNSYVNNFVVSVSGNISGSKKIFYKGKHYPALKITNDFKENVENKKRGKKVKNLEDLLSLLKIYNLDEVIDLISCKKQIQNLVISSIDEEIYSLKEFMNLSLYYKEILETIDYLLKILGLDKAILATKSTNFKSIKNVKAIIGSYPNIRVTLVSDKYLISEREFLCFYLNLNTENTLVLETSLIYKLYLVLIKRRDIESTIITISGDALEKSLVIKAKLGSEVEDIVKKLIKIKDCDYEVYVNGYLRGKKVKKLSEIIVTSDLESVVINKVVEKKEVACINCGACYKICPKNIDVLNHYLKKEKSDKCLSCGLCNYICPSYIDLKKVVSGDACEK